MGEDAINLINSLTTMQKKVFYLAYLLLMLICLCFLIGNHAIAQTSFTGTYKNELYGTTLTLSEQRGEYRGTLSTGYMDFELSATLANGELSGKVFHGNQQHIPWKAKMVGEQLLVEAYGGRHPYRKISPSASPPKGGSKGILSSNEAQRIAGSKLHWYQEASIFASSGGAYGEIDFCSDGTFRDYSESSVMVEAGPDNYNREYYDQMGSAGAASVSRSSGYWTIVKYQGVAYVGIQYSTGATASAPLTQVMSGTWYVGKRKYAMGWGKGQCP